MSLLLSQTLPHLGAALVLACIIVSILRRPGVGDIPLAAIAASTITLCLVPIAEYTLSHYLRVLTGDLSIVGMGLLLISLGRNIGLKKIAEARTDAEFWVLLTIVVAAALLYPTALGLGYFDLYAIGYQPMWLLPLVAILTLQLLWYGHLLLAITSLIAVIAYHANWLESDNLWDYLMDPVIVCYAIYCAVANRQRIRALRIRESNLQTLLALCLITTLISALTIALV